MIIAALQHTEPPAVTFLQREFLNRLADQLIISRRQQPSPVINMTVKSCRHCDNIGPVLPQELINMIDEVLPTAVLGMKIDDIFIAMKDVGGAVTIVQVKIKYQEKLFYRQNVQNAIQDA